MIEAHALDAWTRSSDRSTHAFRNLTILGGFAAPLFLFLAGVGLVLSAEAAWRRSGSRSAGADRVVRRGVEIFILAFLFRLQAFIVSPGNPLIAIFRVDILNVMGPSLVAAALIWLLVRQRTSQAFVFGALAVGVAMLTPLVRTAAWVDTLPIWMQWYVRPAGEHTTFTMFPWSGFVLAGAACAAVLSASSERRLTHFWMAAAGVLVTVLGFYTASQPSIYRSASFWTSSPAYFAIRVGILMLACEVLLAIEHAIPIAARVLAPVERFGRASLFVYWIHVELVYGYATWLIHRRLGVSTTIGATIAFAGLMLAAIDARDRVFPVLTSWRRVRLPVQPLPTSASVVAKAQTSISVM